MDETIYSPQVISLVKILIEKSIKMKNFTLWFPFQRQFYWVLSFVLIAAISITGPLLSYRASYSDTRIIIHPFGATKHVIKDRSYAVVFDGGSTGTRIHIFSFMINPDVKQKKITLDGERFFRTEPGLSSYADCVTNAADSLEPLLKKAREIIPSVEASLTPLILKATAGLRLLSGNTSEEILHSVEERLRSLPYKMDNGAVSMLNERDEGLFAWYTVNFLMGNLHNISDSYAALDLGGGSTQVTFSTNNVNTLVMSPSHYITKFNVEGEPEYIYTHSYLGSGLNSARKSILLKNFTHNLLDSSSNHHVASACFKILTNRTAHWFFSGDKFFINYDNRHESPFEACYQETRQFVLNSNIDKPKELVNREIAAMSFFYDRMKDIRVIKSESGHVKVRDYFLYAENICDGIIRMRRQNIFLCMDLVYIASYLHDGLGLPLYKDIWVVKKINGIETSWALGAAINTFGYN